MRHAMRCAPQKPLDLVSLMTRGPATYPATSDPPRAQPGAHGFYIIFGQDDAPGKRFDVAVILLIGASIVVALLDSVGSIRTRLG